jgi:hypothetical protein
MPLASSQLVPGRLVVCSSTAPSQSLSLPSHSDSWVTIWLGMPAMVSTVLG